MRALLFNHRPAVIGPHPAVTIKNNGDERSVNRTSGAELEMSGSRFDEERRARLRHYFLPIVRRNSGQRYCIHSQQSLPGKFPAILAGLDPLNAQNWKNWKNAATADQIHRQKHTSFYQCTMILVFFKRVLCDGFINDAY